MIQIRLFSGDVEDTMHGTCVSHVFAKLLDAIILELIRGHTIKKHK